MIGSDSDNRLYNISGAFQVFSPNSTGQHQPIRGMAVIMDANLMAFPIHSSDQIWILLRSRSSTKK